jgi:hypothetical protein
MCDISQITDNNPLSDVNWVFLNKETLVFIGFRNGKNQTYEMFVRTDDITRTGNITHGRVNSALVTHNKCVYCFGGRMNQACTDVADIYSASNWWEMPSMPKALSYPSAVVFRRQIYLTG